MPATPHLDRITERALALGAIRMAVAYPLSAGALEATLAARRIGLIDPILVGPKAKIEALAKERGLDVSTCEIADTPDDPLKAAFLSVAMCRDGRAKAIMKGSLHTDELMAAVVAKETGLRTKRRVSHVCVYDVPTYPKPLLLADSVVNIQPTLMDKRDIIQNAVDIAHLLGIAMPKVAVLSAVEVINASIPGTIEAAALAKMAERGQITGAIVDGPLAFDNAISAEALKIKGFHSAVGGEADIIIAPNLEAGNMLNKQLVYLAKSDFAGIILGTTHPVVLTSRADSEKCRVASCALAVLKSHGSRA